MGMSRNYGGEASLVGGAAEVWRKPAGSKLDAYKGSIQLMLGEDPKAPPTAFIERLRRRLMTVESPSERVSLTSARCSFRRERFSGLRICPGTSASATVGRHR